MSEDYACGQYVGIDLHRRRSVIVRMNASGERLETVRIVNDVDRLGAVLARAGESPEVVLEATYGRYWAAHALAAAGASVHLAHPLGVKAFEYRRVKNDERDAAVLMERQKLTADGAFRLLVQASQDSNIKLRDFAERLVHSGELPTTRL